MFNKINKFISRNIENILLSIIVVLFFLLGFHILNKKTCEGLEKANQEKQSCDNNVCITIQENRENLNALDVVYNDTKDLYKKSKTNIIENEKKISKMNVSLNKIK